MCFTLNQILQAAKAKNFQFELYTNVFDITCGYLDYVYPTTCISIKLEEAIWYHFEVSAKYSNTSKMDFAGRYNCNNGAKQRTFKKELKAYKILGLDY